MRLFSPSGIAIGFGGSSHKSNTSYLLLRLYHALVNWISFVLMQMTCGPKMNCIMGLVKKANRVRANLKRYSAIDIEVN